MPDLDREDRIATAVEAHVDYVAASRKKVAAVNALSADEQKEMVGTIKMLREAGADV